MLDSNEPASNWFKKIINDNQKSHNWEDLKKRGNVTEHSVEVDGFITLTRKFVSFDGKETITEVDSFNSFSSKTLRLMDIDSEIKQAIEVEDYEKASELKKEKDSILKK